MGALPKLCSVHMCGFCECMLHVCDLTRMCVLCMLVSMSGHSPSSGVQQFAPCLHTIDKTILDGYGPQPWGNAE